MAIDVDRHELRQIIAGLSEGVSLVEPGPTIAYGNEAALAMHGTVGADRARFALRDRNHPASLDRTLDVYTWSDAIVWVRNIGVPSSQTGQ